MSETYVSQGLAALQVISVASVPNVDQLDFVACLHHTVGDVATNESISACYQNSQSVRRSDLRQVLHVPYS